MSAEPTPALPAGKGTSGLLVLRFLVFAVLLGFWTWKLLEPYPIPESLTGLTGRLGEDWRFYAAKSLHVGAYAFLTVLAVTFPLARYWKWYLVSLLALHGAATEIGQTFVLHRSGRVWDVVIDWCGIGLGLLVWWFWPRAAK